MKEKIVTPIIAEVLYRDVRDLKEKKNQPTIWPISLESELTFFT